MMHSKRAAAARVLFSAVSAFVGACTDPDPGTKTPVQHVFESADPSGMTSHDRGPGTAAPDANDVEGAARVIEEADIFKVVGDRLYALSRYGGLSIVDVADADHLHILGRYKVPALPLEMVVRGTTVLALYNNYGQYVEVDGAWNWTESSQVLALDASDPAHIAQASDFTLPGTISDSRVVGDVLYVVTFENGVCWDCTAAPQTNVVSLTLSDPDSIEKVDELSFQENPDALYSWQRSIAVTEERIYIAGPEYASAGAIGSTISVIDISDPGGALTLGPSVQVAGQISNRWQMDEYQGVLRVVSQAGGFQPDLPPQVETFSVDSNALTPLGATELIVPRGESLRSVRFDGPRAYAITALQTDPLFTIDLSDPTQPLQAGELVMPGWVLYMEPRADRVVGLGFDQGNPNGALNVSLFDVSDLAQPALLSRVNFGGDWAWLAEDPDRIQKAFRVLDDAGLILMPFSGWSSAAGDLCGGTYKSGVQLIDFDTNNLTLRGVAESLGEARRGFLLDDRLLTISDDRLQVFDVSERGAPSETASVALAQMVTRTVQVGNNVVRVAQNWWTNSVQLDITEAALAAEPQALGQLVLPTPEADTCYGGSWLADVLVSGDSVYVLYTQYNRDQEAGGKQQATTRVLTVNVSDPSAPVVEGDANVEFGSFGGSWAPGVVDSGKSALAVGAALVFVNREYGGPTPGPTVVDGTAKDAGSPNSIGSLGEPARGASTVVRVVDMRDPNAPVVHAVVPEQGVGSSGLFVTGTTVALSHQVVSPEDASRVRFFLDRIDVSDPSNPKLQPALNMPGSLLAVDDNHHRLMAVSYKRVQREDLSATECFEAFANANFQPQSGVWNGDLPGTCSAILQQVNLAEYTQTEVNLVATYELEPDESISGSALGDDRLFLALRRGYGYRYGVADGVATNARYAPGWYPVAETDMPLLVVAGLKSGDFAHGRLLLTAGEYWGNAPLAATGSRAVLAAGWRGQLSIINAENAERPELVREVELSGSPWQVTAAGNLGIVSMGYDGVEVVNLSAAE